MKYLVRLLSLIVICGYSSPSIAQTLTQVRAYFDDNANGYQFFSVPALSSLNQPFQVNVQGLSKGIHVLYLEVKDNNGRWSFYDRANIQIQGGLQMATLNAAEYFFDNDPGLGAGIQIPIGANGINQELALDLTGLSNGMHMAYIRVVDGAGQWSLYAQRLFQVVGNAIEEIVAAEYFFDNDPGLGNGFPISLNGFAASATLELDLNDLSNGVHTLYIRVKDANGIWSLYDQANFTVTNPVPNSYLVIAEYFFDNDPGEGNAIPLIIPQEDFVDDNFQLDIPSNLSNGIHTVCIRVLNGAGFWSNVSCESITVCQIPIPEIVATGNACTDGFVTLSVTNPVYDTYSWSTGANATSIQVAEPGEYLLTVNDNGCSAQASFDAQFNVVAAPQVTITGNACPQGQQLITIVNDYDAIVWPDGSTDNSYTVTATGIYPVQVTTGACTRTDPIVVNFIQPFSPEISLSGNACLGETVTLSVPADTPGVLWNTGSSAPSIEVTGSGTYSVTAFNQGCPVSAALEVVFSQPPLASIASTGEFCSGETVVLQATTGFDGYTWNTGESLSSIEVTESGTYSVSVFSGDCFSLLSVEVEFTTVPTPTISTNQNTLACDQAGVQYQWYFNGTAINGATGQFYTASQSGFYSVQIAQNGCTATSSILNFTYISVEENDVNLVKAWPNPASDRLFIQAQEAMQRIIVTDATGRIIYTEIPAGSQHVVRTERFAAGTYILHVITDTAQHTMQVVFTSER